MNDREAQMWGGYQYKGYDVQVIQKWRDPYGKSMVRVAAFDDPDMALGLSEDEFLAEAVFLKDASPISD